MYYIACMVLYSYFVLCFSSWLIMNTTYIYDYLSVHEEVLVAFLKL